MSALFTPPSPRQPQLGARRGLAAFSLACVATLVSLTNAQCPDSSWGLYVDSSGVEGVNSCVKHFAAPAGITWNGASAACTALGAHLLTSLQVRHGDGTTLPP